MTTKFVTVPPIAADVLSRAIVQGNAIVLPAGQLDRPIYEAVNKVLTAMGGKWNKKAGGHLFAFDPAQMLADALGSGRAVNRQQTLQLFETPVDLADRMVALAGITAKSLVSEPSAGHGRLVNAARAKDAKVVAVEIDPTNAGILSRIDGVEVHQDDFLEWATREHRRFDAVIMNPPFAGNQDIRHIRAAWELLRDGGRLVAIVSEHPFFGSERDCVDFRLWLNTIGADTEALPPSTFASSGTTVRTRLITATKAAVAAFA